MLFINWPQALIVFVLLFGGKLIDNRNPNLILGGDDELKYESVVL